jgi:hypothetical protein
MNEKVYFLTAISTIAFCTQNAHLISCDSISISSKIRLHSDKLEEKVH